MQSHTVKVLSEIICLFVHQDNIVTMFQVNLYFFAKSRELTGTNCTSHDLPARTTAKDVLNSILAAFPRFGGKYHRAAYEFILRCSLSPIQNSVVLAVNQTYIEWNQELVLRPGDEVAVIPPISGG